VAASLKARSDDPSKQYRGGQFTPSQIAAGVAASLKTRSDDLSKQYRGGQSLKARSIWTIQEQEMFNDGAIVHGMGRWYNIAASMPNKNITQVTNFGKYKVSRFSDLAQDPCP